MSKLNQQMKKKILVIVFSVLGIFILLLGRVLYIQIFESDFLQTKAYEQQTRDRLIKPVRGDILDRNLVPIATTETVASISVINAQVKNSEQVAKILSEKLNLNYDDVLKKVIKKVALNRIQTKVDKKTADDIRKLNIPGVVIDEDIKRVYPYSNLASQVIGFVGKDNQGIVGLEAKYDNYLKGSEGKILTETDARGNKMPNGSEKRVEPKQGDTLVTTIDITLQQYVEQTLNNALSVTKAKRGAIILMDPNNGEILAMANKPDFDLNAPFTPINPEEKMIWDSLTPEEQTNYLNQMWRNFSINDTYEPGSTFKIITSTAGLEEGVVNVNSQFNCTGSLNVAGKIIKCWKTAGHGSENFIEGVKNSCNPVFMAVAAEVGADKFYDYMQKYGFMNYTGIDLPGEAKGIMHKKTSIGPLELATMSFGQSFQITPMQLLRGASIVVNGGFSITPHFCKDIQNTNNEVVATYKTGEGERLVSQITSDTMKNILEQVVFSGTGNKTYIPGYRVGGKTATSQKLPRGNGKYIASFLAFAPADKPKVVALVLIDEPVGAYYGGQICGPIMKTVLTNALPYLGVKPNYTEEEAKLPEVATVTVPNFIGLNLTDAKKSAKDLGLELDLDTDDKNAIIISQFPLENEIVNAKSKIILKTK